MANYHMLRGLRPLGEEQLWTAAIEPPLQIAFVDGVDGQSAGELQALGSEAYTKEPTAATPFEGLNRYRWLAAAVASDHPRFESDIRYGDYLEATEGALRSARRLGDEQLESAIADAQQLAIEKRARRYAEHARQLSRFIRERGDIYLGFGLQGASSLQVAKLEDIAPAPPKSRADGRREPIAILSGRDGEWGLRPLRWRVRRELFVATRPPR
ncbi:MAG TPA: hypothetical protein VGE30_01070 [Candidatus Saccharimonadales bacterium]